MTRIEKIKLLKEYRNLLIYSSIYKVEEDIAKEKENKEPQKVLVLKRKFNGKYVRVA